MDHEHGMKAATKTWLVRAGATVLLAVPVVVLGLVATEIGLRLSRSRSFVTYQPCMRRAKGYSFLSYAPNCVSRLNTEHGWIEYHFNEDGLRDRPKATFSKGAVLALGDSITKGMYLDDGETIPRLLESALGPASRFPVLNGGIRYNSPVPEFRLYQHLKSEYPIKAVVQFLNGTDAIDERFYYALATKTDGNGVPELFAANGPDNPIKYGAWLEKLYHYTEGKIYLIELLRQRINFARYVALAESYPADDFVLCGGIRALADELKRDHVPQLIVFTPVPRVGIERIWPGMKFVPADLAHMVDCARKAGVPVLDLSGVKPDPSWYVADDLHPTPAGAKWITEQVTPALRELLRKNGLSR